MPREQAGVAAAIATTSRQFGQAIGVAVVGAIVASSAGGSAAAGLPSATHAAWWTLTALGAAVLMLGLLGTGKRANESARRTAVTLNPEALAA
jgi:apolipoprotein N-acyltransferase